MGLWGVVLCGGLCGAEEELVASLVEYMGRGTDQIAMLDDLVAASGVSIPNVAKRTRRTNGTSATGTTSTRVTWASSGPSEYTPLPTAHASGTCHEVVKTQDKRKPCRDTRCPAAGQPGSLEYPLYVEPCPESSFFNGQVCRYTDEAFSTYCRSIGLVFNTLAHKESYAIICAAQWNCDAAPDCLEACPYLFEHNRDTGACTTLRAVSDCNRISATATLDERHDFLARCTDAPPFQCLPRSDCERDFDSCPTNTVALSDRVCGVLEPAQLPATCPKFIDLRELDTQIKHNLTEVCGYQFPCLRDSMLRRQMEEWGLAIKHARHKAGRSKVAAVLSEEA